MNAAEILTRHLIRQGATEMDAKVIVTKCPDPYYALTNMYSVWTHEKREDVPASVWKTWDIEYNMQTARDEARAEVRFQWRDHVVFVGPTRYSIDSSVPWDKWDLDGRCTCGWETATYYARENEDYALSAVQEHLELVMQGEDDW